MEQNPGEVGGILGLPLLALLAISLVLNDEYWQHRDPGEIIRDRTSLYRRLVDLTCLHGGNVEPLENAPPRIVGSTLRHLLRRTAAAMTMRGTESISYEELEFRLGEDGAPAIGEAAVAGTAENPIANLMISFFFSAGNRELGCEFVHKSFREYLFAEAIVETLKQIGGGDELPLRAPYWKNFDSGDPRSEAVQYLGPLLAPQWITPEVSRHIVGLLSWEIHRASDPPITKSDGETTKLSISGWVCIRDILADLWDWWAEGAHLRAQPFRRSGWDRALEYEEPYSAWLAKILGPHDQNRTKLPEPIRMTTVDAHLGDALFRLNCTVHFEINKATGWLEPANSSNGRPPWEELFPRRRYQTQIKLPTGNCWVAFRPSSPNGRDQYLLQYVARINAAGWRPEGIFPNGVSMSGIDLSEVEMRTENRTDRPGLSSMCFQYAHLSDTRFSGSSFFNVDFSYSVADRAIFITSILTGSNFCNASLANADFRQSYTERVDFTDAVLHGADFRGAAIERTLKQRLPAVAVMHTHVPKPISSPMERPKRSDRPASIRPAN